MTWTIHSKSTELDTLLLEESLFFNGNGYIGIRGNFEEGLQNGTRTIRGTYLNAFHDIVDIHYGEKLYAFPETQQKLLNVIDTQTIQIYIGEEEEKFSLWEGEVISYDRYLHLDKGVTERHIHWKSPKGKEVKLVFKRLVSFTEREVFIQYISLIPVTPALPVKIMTSLNGDVENFTDPTDPRVASGHAKRLSVTDVRLIDEAAYVEVETYTSGLKAAALSTVTVHNNDSSISNEVEKNGVTTTISFILNGETSVEKRTFFADTLRYENIHSTLVNSNDKLSKIPFEHLCHNQKNYLDRFWENTDVTIHGETSLQEGIRFNLYHLLQSAGQDGVSNIAAKGLSGEGYEGHYFWDTEIYLLPMFTMTNPELAKKLLLYRYSILDGARDRAKEMGHKKGALYPWRTIAGSESSAYFPAGTAQYHISADIAHSYIQYYLATGDVEFIKEAGAEVLIETARLWLETGHYQNGQFRIDTVTGPDEYTCIVNNNYYTNAMAKQNLLWAVKAAKLIKEKAPEKWGSLKDRIQFEDEELNEFNRAAENMLLLVDESFGINPQDDTFLQKAVWDFEGTPEEHYPLLLHYHPLTLYRYQVCKQADTVLAHFLLEDEQSDEIMKNSYDYYEKITTHDSSLSSCVFSMMGARVGYLDKAYDYFIETARLDLDNTHGNTKDGLHMANMGGTWMAITAGFAGMRVKEDGLVFRPQIPKQWKGYSFRVQYHNNLIHIEVNNEHIQFSLISGQELMVKVWNQEVAITHEKPIKVPLKRGV
ncbi:glycoside hydrolase family 65 protein [Bacillus suaedaesalsae]|uniref:glycoside hydrolase family 65 protein n=1 Tax=Bacillus suaedaesalsae TaxID=2810349 RepID=UPI001EF4E144|nr:glycosyl hydrolase family 65 protein [Bacillus suaedaesalsae]